MALWSSVIKNPGKGDPYNCQWFPKDGHEGKNHLVQMLPGLLTGPHGALVKRSKEPIQSAIWRDYMSAMDGVRPIDNSKGGERPITNSKGDGRSGTHIDPLTMVKVKGA
jgi:hypothetical protein